jgi:parvulin-like peptidyl-prolyl isomerase
VRVRRFVVALLLSCVVQSQVVDRVAATVNGRAILVSQVDESCRFAALLDGRKPESITDFHRAAALSQLIDQELIRQRTSTTGFVAASDQEVASRSPPAKTKPAGKRYLGNMAWMTAISVST